VRENTDLYYSGKLLNMVSLVRPIYEILDILCHKQSPHRHAFAYTHFIRPEPRKF
jgi:hypothetical protein